MRLSEAEYLAYLLRQGQAPEAPEGVLQAEIRRLARDSGWLTYHTYDSRRSDEGFPDLVLVKPGHPVYFWELKRAREKPRLDQQRWLDFVNRATGVCADVKRPADWPQIEALLLAPLAG